MEEEFLLQMRTQTQNRDKALAIEVERLTNRETVEFRFFVLLSLVTLTFIAGGGVLVLTKHIDIAVVSGVVGLCTGYGAITMNGVVRETNRRRDAVSLIHEDNIRTLQAVQGALLVANAQARDKEVARLSAWLRDRASKTSDHASLRSDPPARPRRAQRKAKAE